MKRYLCTLIICSGSLFLGIVGCTFMNENSVATATLPLSYTATTIPTATRQPVETSTPASNYIVFPAVTLSPQDSESALLELLKTNGNCIGKCVAGIQPDNMTVQNAVDKMAQWGMVRISENNQGKTFINLTHPPLYKEVIVDLSVGTWTKKFETIDKVALSIHGNDSFLREDVWLANREIWLGFRLDNILKAYGIPSYVGYFFQTTVEIGAPLEGRTVSYSIDIQYEETNLVVTIGALAYYDGENLFLCPSKDPHTLGIEINPERSLIERQEFRPVTWHALTSTDLNMFYQTFTGDNAFEECVTTNLEQIQTLQPSFR